PAQAAPYSYHLRYAPRIGWLPNASIPEQLEVFAEYGFRAFEYNGLPRHTNQEIESYRKVMDRLGMNMGVFVVNSGGWKGDAMVDKAFHAAFLKDVRRAVEIHNIIGNECATVCSGLAVKHLSGEQQTANCIEVLKRAGEIVERTKMVLVLEPLNIRVDHAGYFVVFSDHGKEIISAVNHPNIRLLFDMYHQQISEGNLIGHLQKHWDWIGYFQVGDVPGRKEPDTGEVNWRNVFKAIHAKGYKGMLGMEHGLSEPGAAGMKKCFEAYRRADRWDG
ncbi:MAG: TIM barrel protein, partial [Acidobacteriia bacterium]|nr:TIM barrel protein [Terriglobia bacterium]